MPREHKISQEVHRLVAVKGFTSDFWERNLRPNIKQENVSKSVSSVSTVLNELESKGLSARGALSYSERSSRVTLDAAINLLLKLKKAFLKFKKAYQTHRFAESSLKFSDTYLNILDPLITSLEKISIGRKAFSRSTAKIASEGFNGPFWEILMAQVFPDQTMREPLISKIKDNLLILRGLSMSLSGSLSEVSEYNLEKAVSEYEKLESNLTKLDKKYGKTDLSLREIYTEYKKVIDKELKPAQKKLAYAKAKKSMGEDGDGPRTLLDPRTERKLNELKRELIYAESRFKYSKDLADVLEKKLTKSSTLDSLKSAWEGRLDFQVAYREAKEKIDAANNDPLSKELNLRIVNKEKIKPNLTLGMTMINRNKFNNLFRKVEGALEDSARKYIAAKNVYEKAEKRLKEV